MPENPHKLTNTTIIIVIMNVSRATINIISIILIYINNSYYINSIYISIQITIIIK